MTFPAGSVTCGADRSWGETLQFATRANACANERRTSAPSRAGLLIWRAAGLLRRLRCGRARSRRSRSATYPLTGLQHLQTQILHNDSNWAESRRRSAAGNPHCAPSCGMSPDRPQSKTTGHFHQEHHRSNPSVVTLLLGPSRLRKNAVGRDSYGRLSA